MTDTETGMENALRLIITKSRIAASDAMRCLEAIRVGSPMVQHRFNMCVQAAFDDPDAQFTAGDRAFIANQIRLPEDSTRDFMLRVRLTDAERARLAELADSANQTMSEYVRRQIFHE